MIRLVRAELLRSRSRMLVLIVAVGSLAVALLLSYQAFEQSQPPAAEELRQQTEFFESSHQEWVEQHDAWYSECVESEATEREAQGNPTLDYGCETTLIEPKLEDWLYTESFSSSASAALNGYLQIILGGAFLIGASLIAAEASTGNLGMWLTFAPRRGRVLASKLAASGITALLYGLLAAAFMMAGVAGGTAINDAFDPNPELWKTLALEATRGIALVTVAGVAGAAIGALVRHTAAVLGIILGYMVIVEGMIGSLNPWMQPWLLLTNIRAVLESRVTLMWQECTINATNGFNECVDVEKVLTLADGSLYLGILMAVLLTATWLVFRRRDVS